MVSKYVRSLASFDNKVSDATNTDCENVNFARFVWISYLLAVLTNVTKTLSSGFICVPLLKPRRYTHWIIIDQILPKLNWQIQSLN